MEATMPQASVSIRELKNRLSHFLRLTKEGESLIITDRGTPIGRIVPIVQTGKRLDEHFAAMKQAGQLEWSGRKLSKNKPISKARGKRSVSDLLVENRE
jgi:prevent-host-death family protein